MSFTIKTRGANGPRVLFLAQPSALTCLKLARHFVNDQTDLDALRRRYPCQQGGRLLRIPSASAANPADRGAAGLHRWKSTICPAIGCKGAIRSQDKRTRCIRRRSAWRRSTWICHALPEIRPGWISWTERIVDTRTANTVDRCQAGLARRKAAISGTVAEIGAIGRGLRPSGDFIHTKNQDRHQATKNGHRDAPGK